MLLRLVACSALSDKGNLLLRSVLVVGQFFKDFKHVSHLRIKSSMFMYVGDLFYWSLIVRYIII